MKQIFSLAMLRQRMQFYHNIRNFFIQHQALEVETPILSNYGATDVHIDSFVTHWQGVPQYLQTSPEFAMKRLLAAGVGDCFQLCKVFRNESRSHRHCTEFTLLEWYRVGFSLYDLIDEVAALIKSLHVDWQALPVEVITYQQVFATIGINPHRDDLITLKQKTIALSGYTPNLSEDRDEWLDFLLVTQIERQLGQDKLTFLTHYPSTQAALAKKIIDTHGNSVAERFELYYQGIELANGFHELTDATEQQARFEADNQERQRLGKPIIPMDKSLLAALSDGMPDCSGVALGVDRLLMLKLGCTSIEDIMLD